MTTLVDIPLAEWYTFLLYKPLYFFQNQMHKFPMASHATKLPITAK